MKRRTESQGRSPETTAESAGKPTLGTLLVQAERLIATGVTEHAVGLSTEELREAASDLHERVPDGALLVVSQRTLPASRVTPLMRLPDPVDPNSTRSGFVVEDMTDVDSFVPTTDTIPAELVYAVANPFRGDEMRNWSPAEATEALTRQGRASLTLVEGIHWVLQDPSVLSRNACYMTIGSRLPKGQGFDSRTPAVWISNGTGRDGRERRGAPKVGWCWWNNRHSWLGFASCGERYA